MKIIDLRQTAVALVHSLLPDPKVSEADKCYDALKRAMERQRDADVARLRSWGRECCGGDGEAINPTTGKPWGDSFFDIANMLEARPIVEP